MSRLLIVSYTANDGVHTGEAERPACYCWHGLCWSRTHCYLHWRKCSSVMYTLILHQSLSCVLFVSIWHRNIAGKKSELKML